MTTAQPLEGIHYVAMDPASNPRAHAYKVPNQIRWDTSCPKWTVQFDQPTISIQPLPPVAQSVWTTRFYLQLDDWVQKHESLPKSSTIPNSPWLRFPKLIEVFQGVKLIIIPTNYFLLDFLIDFYDHRKDEGWIRRLGTPEQLHHNAVNLNAVMYLVSQYSVTSDPYQHFKRIKCFLDYGVMTPSSLQTAFTVVLRTMDLTTLYLTSTKLFWDLTEQLGFDPHRVINMIEAQCLACASNQPEMNLLTDRWFLQPLEAAKQNMKQTFPHFLSPSSPLPSSLSSSLQRLHELHPVSDDQMVLSVEQVRPLAMLWVCMTQFVPRLTIDSSAERAFLQDDIKRFVRHFLYQLLYESKGYNPFQLA